MTDHPRTYSLFLIWGLVPTYFAAMSLSRGQLHAIEAAMLVFTLAWWAVAIALRSDLHGARWFALALVAGPLSLGIVQTLRRAAFVLRYRSLELPSGDGSPLAFLVGFFTELLILVVPLTALAILLWHAARAAGSNRSRPAV